VAEAITKLDAGLEFFDRSATAVAMLESFFVVALPQIESAVLGPEELGLPDELGDERVAIQGLIEKVQSEIPRRRRFLTTSERAFDLTDSQVRRDYARLAYCAALATVWGPGRSTTYFEAADYGGATYWLPDGLKAAFFAQLSADGLEVPAEWRAAIAKEPRLPWWRRGRMT
jgi:hypothetical protein